jgi:putative ABC transport system permease protein
MNGRTSLFLRLLVKAAWVRRDRALTGLLSIVVVATMATVGLTVYADLNTKMNREFRGFGANVIVSAREASASGAFTDADAGKILSSIEGKGTGAVVHYAIARGASGIPVVVGGADLKALLQLNSWWSLTRADSEILVGARAAQILSPNGAPFQISYNGRTLDIKPDAIFRSGSEDDSRIYVNSGTFAQLVGNPPPSPMVQLRLEGSPQQMADLIARLSAEFPQAGVKPIRAITETQASVLGKTRAVVLAASSIVVVLIVLCMVATLTGSVLERRKDFAVMKALGASDGTVSLMFAGEASMVAAAGGLVGFVLGSAIAWWIGQANFGSAIAPHPLLLAPVVLGSIALALVASSAPLRLLRRIQPAVILRGE